MLNSIPYKRSLHLISTDSLLFSITYFMTLSILALYMDAFLKLSTLETASIVMMSSFGSKVTRLLISPFIDLLKPVNIVFLSALVMSLSCFTIAFTQKFLMLLFAICAFGISYGTNSILIRAVAGTTSDSNHRAVIFVRLSVITNFGSMAAPLVAIYLFNNISPRLPFFIASGLMFCFALFTLWSGALWPTLGAQKKWTKALREQLADVNLRHYFILTALCWAIYSQLFTSLPLQINKTFGQTNQFGYLLTFNAIMSIILAPRLQSIFIKFHINSFQTVCFSLIAHALGSLLFHFAVIKTDFYIALIIWTFGELLLIPTLQSCISGYAANDILISVLAINSVAMGFGEGAGGFIGVYLIKNTSYCFIIFSILAIVTLVYVTRLKSLFKSNNE